MTSTPGSVFPGPGWPLRMGTTKAWTPWSVRLLPFEPPPFSCGILRRAKTVAACPSSAALPIHHLRAPSSGVEITHSSRSTSRTASVCSPATLLPCPSSVIAKHPGSLNASMSSQYLSRCFSVPRDSTEPPHSEYWTPVFTVVERSTSARSSPRKK